MITGFNPADMYAAGSHQAGTAGVSWCIQRIGEFTIHKEFVSPKVPEKRQAC
jgi:hypothetical protein